mgnify:CR=1 FL=1
MKTLKPFIFLIFFHFSGFAQQQKAWFAESFTGFQAGWWMYNHGTTDPGIFANQGLDYSHFSAFIPIGIASGLAFKRSSLALSAAYTIYFDKELRRHTNTPSVLATYPVSDGWTRLVQLGIQADHTLIQRKNFGFGPFARLGWFKLLAEPPQSGQFGYSWFWQLGFQAKLQIGRSILFLRPSYQENMISIKNPDLDGAKHSLFSLGAEIGYRLNLTNGKK